MSDLVQDLINKRGDSISQKQAILKTYILQFMYRDGNGWAFVNATTPNQAEKIFKNQTKYVDARVIAIKETKWYGDSMQLVFEGAVTTFKNIDITVDLSTILRSTGQYDTLEDFLVNYLGLDNYYTKEEIDDKLADIGEGISLTNYYTKDEINERLRELPLDGVDIYINEDGNWVVDGNDTGISALGKDGKDGIDGVDGRDGIDGKDGINGTDGKDGRDGVDGKDGKDGKDGTNGINGVNGTNGRDGKDGKDGKDGRDGIDAAEWTIGEDGYWYKDGVNQGYKAVGQDGTMTFEDLTEEQRAQLTGLGVSDIIANYALSNSNATAPTNSSSWSTVIKTPTSSQKYLWARFIFILTDDTTRTLGPFVLGNYAKDGTGGGDGVNVDVVNSEEEATDQNTIYFFDDSLLQGVGLYNTLLQQGWIDLPNGRHYYHPSVLYQLYSDGSFDIIEPDDDHNTVVKDNTIYYKYKNAAGEMQEVRTPMKQYGDIMIPHNIHYAQTSDTAYIPLRVTGPFFAQETPVTITYNSNEVTVYEVTQVTAGAIPEYTSVKVCTTTKQVINNGDTISFNFNNFTQTRQLLVVRKYSNLNDLKTSLKSKVTFSTPYEGNKEDVFVMFGKSDIFYKAGTDGTMGHSKLATLNPSRFKQIVGKDFFLAETTGYITVATSYLLDQTKRNMFYVKMKDPNNRILTLQALRDRRVDTNLPNTSLSGNIITYNVADSFICNRIKYFGITMKGSGYSLKKVSIVTKNEVAYNTLKEVTGAAPITVHPRKFLHLEVGDTITIEIEPKNGNTLTWQATYVDGDAYLHTDRVSAWLDYEEKGIYNDTDANANLIGQYYSSKFTGESVDSVLCKADLFGSSTSALKMQDLRVEVTSTNERYNRPGAAVASANDNITIDTLRFYMNSDCCVEEVGIITFDEYRKFNFE